MKGFWALQRAGSVMSCYESRPSWQKAGGCVSEGSSAILAVQGR
jgi:hypothetical protein